MFKRIRIIALDYGLTFGVDRAIRQLIGHDRLSGIGVIPVSPLMKRETKLLREVVAGRRHQPEIGMMIAVTHPFTPLSVSGRIHFGETFPTIKQLRRRMRFGLVPARVLAEEITAQHAAFVNQFDRLPDFIDGWQDVTELPVIRRAFGSAGPHLAWAEGAWYRLGGLSGSRRGRFANKIGRFGVTLSPGVRIPTPDQKERHLHNLFFNELKLVPEGTAVICRPAEIDDRLRQLDEHAASRELIYRFLAGPDLQMVLQERDLFLF